MFVLPFRPVYDANGKFIPGAKAWFTLTGTNVPSPVYFDDDLTVPLTNPIIANAAGKFPKTYLDPAVTYRVRIYDDDVRFVDGAPVGGSTPIEEYDPYTAIEEGGQGKPGQAGEGYATRSAMAAATPAPSNLDDAYLTEYPRAGKFIFYTTAGYLAATGRTLATDVAVDTEQGVFVARASGAWVRQHNGFLTPAMFGALGNDVTDDRAKLQVAMTVSALLRAPLSVTGRHFLTITVAATLRYPSGLTMMFSPTAHLNWSRGDLPCLWGHLASNVRIIDPKFVFSGTIPTGGVTADATTLYNTLGRAVGDHFGAGNLGCGFGMFGGDNVKLVNPTFEATDYSAPNKLMAYAACFFSKPGPVLSKDCGIEGTTTLDGCIMGLLGGGQTGWRSGDFRSKRYGVLDPAVYTSTPPPHAVYFSGQTTPTITSIDCEFGNLYDESTAVPGTVSNVTATSWKFIEINGLRTGNLHGRRPWGILEYKATNYTFGFFSWEPSTAAALTGSAVAANGVTSEGSFIGGRLVLPADYPTNRVVLAFDQFIDGGTNALDFGRVEIIQKGTLVSTAILGSFQNCQGHFIYRAPANTNANLTFANITNGGDDNHFTVNAELPDIGGVLAVDTLRLVENDKVAATNNSMVVTDIRSGSVVTLTQGQKHGTYRISKEVSFAAAATSGSSITIPGGAHLRSATAITTVADGTATGWAFGTPTTTGLFGNRGNFAVLGGTTDASWSSFAYFRQAAAVTLVVTLTGASDGAGKVLTNVVYDFATTNINTNA